MNVIWPFEDAAVMRCINVFLVTRIFNDFQIVADEYLYKLVLFNLVQNSIKFNKPSFGDIVITIELKKSKEPSHKRGGDEQVFIL